MLKEPKTLLQAVRYYSNEAVCVEFLSNVRWGEGTKACNRCGSTAVYGLRTRPVFKCRDCKKQFSIKVGTIMQDSALSITKWVPAIWMVVNCKNGISSCEMARALGVTQKTAWHMCHRIRAAVANGTMEKFSGVVEADETYIGGEEKNKHAVKRATSNSEAMRNKVAVMGIVERGGRVSANVLDDHTARSLKREVRAKVAKGSTLITDELNSYKQLRGEYDHNTVNHSAKEYVRGSIHTNTIEGFFGLFKRTLKGTYIHVETFHLDRYLQEQGFRYNHRKDNDSGRFATVASQILGTTLTYAELTGANQ